MLPSILLILRQIILIQICININFLKNNLEQSPRPNSSTNFQL